jgi:hypothetical protein
MATVTQPSDIPEHPDLTSLLARMDCLERRLAEQDAVVEATVRAYRNARDHVDAYLEYRYPPGPRTDRALSLVTDETSRLILEAARS